MSTTEFWVVSLNSVVSLNCRDERGLLVSVVPCAAEPRVSERYGWRVPILRMTEARRGRRCSAARLWSAGEVDTYTRGRHSRLAGRVSPVEMYGVARPLPTPPQWDMNHHMTITAT